jgi:hypothetical protein
MLSRLHDFATALAPYESLRLAKLSLGYQQRSGGRERVSTIYELRARMVKRGLRWII